MANEEHLAILKQGVEEWNKWRKSNPYILPNLIGVDLSGAKLSGIDLSGAKLGEAKLNGVDLSNAYIFVSGLRRAELRGANLNGAYLNEANLEEADFSEANLRNVDLSEANLNGASLIKADLSGANLNGANLTEADLLGANLKWANLKEAIFHRSNWGIITFYENDLSKCIGLDSISASFPSSIDFSTLQTTASLPKTFLQKMGFPPLLADYLPDFYTPTLRLFPVYLAHASANKAFARKLYEALIQKGVQVWFDIKKLKPGDEIYEGISRGITHYDKMILVCSRESLAESWWVDREIDRVLKKERELFRERSESIHLLIPIAIDDYVFQWNGAKGEDVRRYTIGDFKEWQDETKFDQALNELIQALHVDRPDVKPPSFL